MYDSIKSALLSFSWSNFGLDDVESAETEWADDLTNEILDKLVADGWAEYEDD